ncbi:uncharacterized protein BO87DRAFT_189744 [Aspergillus neoniger CBS 115656]|uniref:Uncharacterized protein n=1 Tax=Aspergillus neoniger (strain CBS 115656) TaxID=1448310 RepID=A0A318YTA7_ASPNB|nr:hypothetical protein BO87DRAFT_189744 [Aspergillus neoniger CBS 115656]PYH37931.1 hypothetical protein BO87DRAFT_189744 [Aspergillus neoniger CBS 115656]
MKVSTYSPFGEPRQLWTLMLGPWGKHTTPTGCRRFHVYRAPDGVNSRDIEHAYRLLWDRAVSSAVPSWTLIFFFFLLCALIRVLSRS